MLNEKSVNNGDLAIVHFVNNTTTCKTKTRESIQSGGSATLVKRRYQSHHPESDTSTDIKASAGKSSATTTSKKKDGSLSCIISIDISGRIIRGSGGIEGRRNNNHIINHQMSSTKNYTTTFMSNSSPSAHSSSASSSSSHSTTSGTGEEKEQERLEYGCFRLYSRTSSLSSSFSSIATSPTNFCCLSDSCNNMPQQSSSNRTWIRRLWTLHFVFALLMVSIGVLQNNGSRKYIPWSSPVSSDAGAQICKRGFLNVMAQSAEEDGAFVCCDNATSETLFSLCPLKSKGLPLAHRLSRFPDAWILPLSPLFLRIAFLAYDGFLSTGRLSLDFVNVKDMRRLFLYFTLLMIRGWVLYVAFNAIEEKFVQPEPETCWYRSWLRGDQQSCHGSVFDFSDHVVLYFAQILPLALIEVIHAMEHPYWGLNSCPSYYCTSSRRQNFSTTSSYYVENTTAALARLLVPVILCCGMVYLYFVTFLGVWRTTSFFHTGPEIWAGFAVSLLIHFPLHCLQCSDRCERLREYLFPSPPCLPNDKSLVY